MKNNRRYICQNCGTSYAALVGRCTNCGQWGTIAEQVEAKEIIKHGRKIPTESITSSAKQTGLIRYQSGMDAIDKLLGGGLVPGSLNLIIGQPGIGKSTILLQLANALAGTIPVLYISGEEAIGQIGLRAKRLSISRPKLHLATSTSANDIAATILDGSFKLVIVDSIQTVITSEVSSAAGSVPQITNSTQAIMAAAKQTHTAVILVGHVTKDGVAAGPKVLEHMVDVIVQLEGDRTGGFKILRAIKNRYGATDETAIFEMKDNGLQLVSNPSAALLMERQISDGSIVLATMEGNRPLLVEVQALVNPSNYGYAKRAASGLDINRLYLLIAIIERRTSLKLAEKDIYINIVGGIKINEPAADLAVVMAVASAARGFSLKKDAAVFGEVGLSGEVRHVPYADKRLIEAKKMGFKLAIGPTIAGSKNDFLRPVKNIKEALNQFLER